MFCVIMAYESPQYKDNKSISMGVLGRDGGREAAFMILY